MRRSIEITGWQTITHPDGTSESKYLQIKDSQEGQYHEITSSYDAYDLCLGREYHYTPQLSYRSPERSKSPPGINAMLGGLFAVIAVLVVIGLSQHHATVTADNDGQFVPVGNYMPVGVR